MKTLLLRWWKIAALLMLPLVLFAFVWRLRADQKRTFPHLNGVLAVALLPDGKHLATSDVRDGNLNLWDIKARKLVKSEHNGDFRKVDDQFFADGEKFASFVNAYNMEIKDVRTGKVTERLDWKQQIKSFSGQEELQMAVLSNDGTRMVTLTWNPPYAGFSFAGDIIRLWDVERQKLIHVTKVEKRGRKGQISQAVFSADNSLLATGDGRGRVSVWDLKSGVEKYSFTESGLDIAALAFSPDGMLLASGNLSTPYSVSTRSGDSKVSVWSMKDGKLLHSMAMGLNGVTALTFVPNGKQLAVGGSRGRCFLWDLSADRISRKLNGHSDRISDINVSRDGTTLATASWDKNVKLWEID